MTTKNHRIDLVDALRGFAVMAIILLHSIEHFNFYVFPDKATQPDWLNILDKKVWDSLFFMFGGKAYAIFALLFGFTFHLQFQKLKEKGKDFGNRFIWRMVILAGFAALNAAFFLGEILLMYSMVGLIFYIVRNWSSKAVLILSIIMLLQPIEWYHYIMSNIYNDYVMPAKQTGGYWRSAIKGLHSTSFWETVKCNTLYGHKVSLFWAFENGRIEQTMGLFLMGLFFGRKYMFAQAFEKRNIWKTILIISIIMFGVLYTTKLNVKFATEVDKRTLGVALDMWTKLSFMTFMISAFTLLYNTSFFRKITNSLRIYGKMSLTNYITQSIVGGILFYNFGFGLAYKCGSTVSIGIGVVLLILQVRFCIWWINKYKQGPFEKLWHKLTWIKLREKK